MTLILSNYVFLKQLVSYFYYVLKVNNFDDVAKNTIDEWIYFLKNSEVKENFKAKGLDQAKEKLRYESLSEKEKKKYVRYDDNLRIENSVKYTAILEATYEAEQEGLRKGMEKGKQDKEIEVVKNAIKKGLDNQMIADLIGLTTDAIEEIRKKMN